MKGKVSEEYLFLQVLLEAHESRLLSKLHQDLTNKRDCPQLSARVVTSVVVILGIMDSMPENFILVMTTG